MTSHYLSKLSLLLTFSFSPLLLAQFEGAEPDSQTLFPSVEAFEKTESSGFEDSDKSPTEPEVVLIPQMSVIDMEEDNSPLATASGQNNQPAGYALPPGVCSVVEAVVREFCKANPGEISCQFQ